MPEGPEIRRAADRLARALEGRVAREVWFDFDRLARWQPRLTGRTVRAVEPRGKAMLVRFEGGLNLYSHNQLYGRWYVTRAGAEPRSGNRTLRAAVHNDAASAWLFSASDIDVLRDTELERHPYLERLGVDLLDRDCSVVTIRRQIEDPRFGRRALGGLLLDQGFLGGVGNYLRSEILFVAGLDPSRRPVDLDADERRALARSARSITRRAYRTGGVTNDPKIVRTLRAAGLPRSAYRHFVFDRDGEACHRCGDEITRTTVAGRRLYACPACQLEG